MKQLVIFDLDGTLIDTLEDLAAACDMTLEKHGFATHTLEEYSDYIGSGISNLISRALPQESREKEILEELRCDFLKIYTENIDTHTKIYGGINELLTQLQSKGIDIAVASNKFQEGALKLTKSLFAHIKFLSVLGNRDGVPLKPNPRILRDIANISLHSLDDILYVGDSQVDIKTGAAAGVDTVGVTWGFRTREELEAAGAKYIVDSPRELWRYIQG